MAGVTAAEKGKAGIAETTGAPTEKRKKKKGGVRALLATIIVLLALSTAIFFIFRYDLYGIRTSLFSFVHNLDPSYQDDTDRSAELYTWELALSEREGRIATEETRLADQSKELGEREQAVTDREVNRVPVYRPPINEDDVLYMQNIGKIYAAMDATAAADIMVRLYSVEDMAAIVYYMSQSAAAAILENMDPTVAANITDRLLHD